MDDSPSEANSNSLADQHPLLVEQMERHNEQEHIIDITRNAESSSSLSNSEQPSEMDLQHHHEDRLPSGTRGPTHETFSISSSRLNSRNSAFTRRGDGYGHRPRSPLNSGLWISVELLVTMGQVAASIVVLSMSRNENPQAPLFAWVVGYASGCVATLPILYWRFRNRNPGSQQDSIQPQQGSSQRSPPEATSYTAISVNQTSDEEASRSIESTTRNSQIAGQLSSRLNGVMDYFKMVLDCFFAVWFVVGNVWIFGGQSTPADAPKLYKYCRLTIVLLFFLLFVV
uniref:Uncharacterized protein n=2 Tax=Rhizophora mucronata TaxID=61149 RepID=A0A2P2KY44_RHIMU